MVLWAGPDIFFSKRHPGANNRKIVLHYGFDAFYNDLGFTSRLSNENKIKLQYPKFNDYGKTKILFRKYVNEVSHAVYMIHERHTSRRENILTNIFRNFFTTTVVYHSRIYQINRGMIK